MKSGKNEQIEAFRKTARALGCDEDKDKFESQLGKIATHKQKPVGPKKPPTQKASRSRR